MELEQRKREELARKIASLEAEFARWEQASEEGYVAPEKGGLGWDFRKHQSQIKSVLVRLRKLQKRIETDLAGKEGDEFLAACRKASGLLLGVHRIWDFFRSKFSQRLDGRLREYLEIADEFAWECYQPVASRFQSPRPPPLVFLNGGESPFILRRGVKFEGRVEGLFDDADFQSVLANLPFPVIGMPWHQLSYAPEMVVIGHEMGHAVEGDLALQTDLDGAIDAALARSGGTGRAAYWKAWRSELFADAYGCMATGPAFATALADFLASGRTYLEGERESKRDYPPILLRVYFNARLIVSGTIPGWDYALPAHLEVFRKDAEEVAAEFEKLTKALLQFDEKLWKQSKDRAAYAAADMEDPELITQVRVLLAAVRAAFQASPAGYDRPRGPLQKSTLDHLLGDIRPLVKIEVRSGPAVYTEDQKTRDESEADEWFERLGTLI